MTLACLIFVELTLLSKIFLRSGAILGIKFTTDYRSGEGLQKYLQDKRGDDSLVCAYDLAYIFAITFFTVAILLNAIRWVVLINDLQNKTLTKYSWRVKAGMSSILIILGTVSIYRMVAECK